MSLIGEMLWLFVAAAAANTGPVLIKKIRIFDRFAKPMDFNKEYRSHRILGDHKTFRGLIGGAIAASIVGSVQFVLASNFDSLASITSYLDFTNPNIILISAILGVGSILGDAVKSFFKRQVGIKPGHNWFPFDQTDFAFGFLAMSLFFFTMPALNYLVVIALAVILHPLTNIVSWLLKLQSKPF